MQIYEHGYIKLYKYMYVHTLNQLGCQFSDVIMSNAFFAYKIYRLTCYYCVNALFILDVDNYCIMHVNAGF